MLCVWYFDCRLALCGETVRGAAISNVVIVNDIKNCVFGLAKASVYGFGEKRKQKFVMSYTIIIECIRKERICLFWKGVEIIWGRNLY